MGKQRIFNLTQKLRAAAAILMVSSLGFFYPGTVSNLQAQSPAKAKSSSPAGGPKEGIKVHGYWTIEIRNPDGTLVERREFENALTPDGAKLLGSFLRRDLRLGEWAIVLLGPDNQPCLVGANPAPCVIYEPTSQNASLSEPNSSLTLTISPTSGNSTNTAVKGTATAQRNGVISSVRTTIEKCGLDGNICVGRDVFTEAQLPNPINVVAGQIIQVTVVISFS